MGEDKVYKEKLLWYYNNATTEACPRFFLMIGGKHPQFALE